MYAQFRQKMRKNYGTKEVEQFGRSDGKLKITLGSNLRGALLNKQGYTTFFILLPICSPGDFMVL